ncbi:MAG: hypothetical protein QOD99_258 [Chthoniobacter sp.]|nr:hypothetical protein [Chthoniobacter sp.]
MVKPLSALLAVLFPAVCFTQDDAATIKVTTMLHEDGSKTVTKIDPLEHTSSAETTDASNKLKQRIVYALDAQNQPATGTVYNAAGVVVMKTAYQHDGSNRITEETDYTPDGQLMRRFVYEFGSTGKVSKIRAYDANGTELRQTTARPDEKKAPPRRRR